MKVEDYFIGEVINSDNTPKETSEILSICKLLLDSSLLEKEMNE
jgi:hypothetical protein